MNFIFIAVGVLSPKSFSAGIPFIVGIGKALLAKGCNLTIVTSKAGEIQFRSWGLDADFWLIDDREEITEPSLIHISLIMIKRMFKAGFLLRKKKFNKGTVIFATSNLLWEIFPLLLIKDKTLIRISTFHMGYPNPFKGYKGAFTDKRRIPGLRETLAYSQHKFALPCIKYASDLIFAHSNMRHLLLDKGISEQKIMKMEVGVNWGVLNAVTPSEGKYDACWIGRYNPQKGCDDLMEIWEVVSHAERGTKLAIMGNVVKELEPLSKRKHLEESIEFMGPVSEEMKYRVMKGSTIFLFPSYYEALPLAVLEAMACGLPVVAYDLPVYNDIFPRGMVKIPIGDKKAFAQEVMNILSDRERRERLSIEAASVASQYSWDKAAERLLMEANRLKNQTFTA